MAKNQTGILTNDNNKVIFSIVIFLIVFIFFLFMNGEWKHLHLIEKINHSKFVSFGNLVGTVFAIFGFYILYKNYINQKKQTELSVITRLYDNIVTDINDLEYKDNKGIYALYNFDDQHREKANANSVMNHLNLILISFRNLIKVTEDSCNLGEELKELNLTRIFLLFNAKITWPVFHSIYSELYEDSFLADGKTLKLKGLKNHTDSSIIFEIYKDLIRKTYKYLEPKGLIKFPSKNTKMMAIINNH